MAADEYHQACSEEIIFSRNTAKPQLNSSFAALQYCGNFLFFLIIFPMMMKKILIGLISVVFVFTSVNAQVYSNKIIKKDSAAKKEYNFLLPIWGKKVTEKGFDLPYSAGIGINYLLQKSDLIIDNLQVGFNNQEKYALDDIIRFDKAEASAMAVTVRPDFWLFPFLNIYGIAGVSSASTDVGFGIWIPDSTNTEKEIMSMETKIDFIATTFGFGLTPTIGVAGG